MRATAITQIVIVCFELEHNIDREFDETGEEFVKWKAATESLRVLRAEDIPCPFEWVETRFMPMGTVEVEYKTTRVLDNTED